MKAILVIDMPNECCECPCFYDYLRCQANVEANVLGDKKPNNCPLKPMPQKKEVEVKKIEDIMHTEFQINDVIQDKYIAEIKLKTDKLIALGYNKCIDEILGDQK